MSKKILYLDMDGVVADLHKAVVGFCPALETSEKYADPAVRNAKFDQIFTEHPTIFHTLEPMPGAVAAVNALWSEYDIYFLSTAPWDTPVAFSGKRVWLHTIFGDKARKRLILTHRKDLCIGDYLVDDRTANGAGKFQGKLFLFGTKEFPNWEVMLNELTDRALKDSVTI